MRMCIVCRQMKEKKELVRVVKSGDDISVDLTGRANGRGAYVCKSEECASKLLKQKALSRAFNTEVSEEVYKSVAEAILNANV